MSISAVVTVELLEALLSPAAARRKPAEEHLQGMTGPARCQSLLQALGRISQPHLQQMVAVLLRRDILQLQDCSILPAVTVELLAAFSSTNCRQAVGECLAEVCAVLTVLQPETCGPVLQQILQAIGSSVRPCYTYSIIQLGLFPFFPSDTNHRLMLTLFSTGLTR